MPRSTDNLINLFKALSSTAEGLTLREIEERLGVSTSTARRLLEDIGYYFRPPVEAEPVGRAKRWRLSPGVANTMVAFTPEETVELRRAAAALRAAGPPERAKALEGILRKLDLLMAQRAREAERTRTEALMISEQDIIQPGPRPELPDGMLEDLRRAVVERRVVELRYKARLSGRERRLSLEPHGILLGMRHYLVAYESGGGRPDPLLLAMTAMGDVNVTLRKFERRRGFDLAAFATRSFGVFQEEPVEVTWRFNPLRADDVRAYHFHPTQTKTELPDGSIDVTFRAGGQLEMCWELFRWAGDVEVLAPESLRTFYAGQLVAALRPRRATAAAQSSGAGAACGPSDGVLDEG